jgi:hypothetical protein
MRPEMGLVTGRCGGCEEEPEAVDSRVEQATAIAPKLRAAQVGGRQPQQACRAAEQLARAPRQPSSAAATRRTTRVRVDVSYSVGVLGGASKRIPRGGPDGRTYREFRPPV